MNGGIISAGGAARHMSRFILAIVLPCCGILSALERGRAAGEDAPPVNAAAVMNALEGIKAKQSTAGKAQQAAMLRDITAAASSNTSAVAFYEEAVRATRFDGEDREATQFREWKKKESDRFKGLEMQNAVRLHLTYLAIALQRVSGVAVKDLVPELIQYAQEIDSDPASVALGDNLMQQSLAESIFVRWYGIGDWVVNLTDWEMSPGHTDGIYEKTVLPELRKEKSPLLVQYWDDKLRIEAARVSRSQLKFDVENFNQVRRPVLLWERAQDLLLLGQRNKAVNEMLAVIKANPNHADAAAWIAALEKVLRGEQAPAADAQAPKPG